MFRFDRGEEPLDLWMARAWEVRQRNFPSVIRFDNPSQTLPVSVTGKECGLDCAHCGGHYLESMTPIGEAAAKAAASAVAETAACGSEAAGAAGRKPSSYLVSGGCTPSGKVPFAHQMAAIKTLKNAGRLNFHVGLADDAEAAVVGEIADSVSFDMVGDAETIQEVFGLDRTPEDYVASYRALRRHGKVLPHVCLGLRGGQWSGEENALNLLDAEGMDGLVFIVFIPTPGTRYADRKPLPVEEVASFIAQARVHFPKLPIFLGCMRPAGVYRRRLDQLALRAGVNSIVQPARPAVRLGEELGLTIRRSEECCVL